MQPLQRNHWSDHERWRGYAGRLAVMQRPSLTGLVGRYEVEKVDASSNAEDHLLFFHRAFGSTVCTAQRTAGKEHSRCK